MPIDRILLVPDTHGCSLEWYGVEQLGEDCGGKAIPRTGHYAYSGEKDDPRRCMWGFCEILVDETGLRSACITPAQTVTIDGEPYRQPYGRQDTFSINF